jgi:hypothetical protein
MARSQVLDGEDGLQIWRIAVNILNKQLQTTDKGWSSSLGVGSRANISSPQKYKLFTKDRNKPRTWTGSLDKRPKRKNMDMRFGIWNVRSMYRASSHRAVMEEILKYKLDLLQVQELR